MSCGTARGNGYNKSSSKRVWPASTRFATIALVSTHCWRRKQAEARAAKRGIWNSWAYRVLDAADTEKLSRLSHSYQLVEGVVAETGEANGRVYLNFTKDWRTDFTIAIEPKDVPSFTGAGFDLKSLKGRRVRVRGWVEWRNGPMIVADHPEQLELLPEDKNKTGPAGDASPSTGRLNQ
jgi:micrococcal nuclease